jgi:type I restriction enzyme S subunit
MTKHSLSQGCRIVKLAEVAIRVMEKHEASPGSPERWVGADHLDEGDLQIKRWSMSDDPVFPPTFKFKYPIGAVLIHSRNPKKVAIADFSAITGEKIFALASRDESILSPRFLAYVLQSSRFGDFTDEWMTGSVNKFLNWSALEKFEFPLPLISEQNRLVELISSIDDVSNINEHVAKEIEKLIVSTSVEFLEGPTVDRQQLNDVAIIERGVSYKSSDYVTTDGGRPFLTLKAVTRDGQFSPTGMKWVRSDFAFENVARPGDLFFANTDLTPGRLLVGAPFFFTGIEADGDPCFSMDLSRVQATDGRVTNEYLYFVLNLPRIRKEMRRLTGGSTVGHLRLSGVAKIEVPVLNEVARDQFLELARELLEFQSVHLKHIEQMKNLRGNLLERYLAGMNDV